MIHLHYENILQVVELITIYIPASYFLAPLKKTTHTKGVSRNDMLSQTWCFMQAKLFSNSNLMTTYIA